MASIKLDPNKAYRVNFRLLEAEQPSTVKIGVAEKPVVTPPPPPTPSPAPLTCITKPSEIWNVLDKSNSTHWARYFQYMTIGDVWSVKFPKRSELIARAPDRFPGAGGPNSNGAGGVGDGFVQFFVQIWGYSGQLQHAPPEGVEHAISYCSGDFDTAPAGYSDWNQKHYKGRWQDPFVYGSFGVSYASPGWNDKTIFRIGGNQYTVKETSLPDVIVDPNRDFYMNFRYTKVAADRIDKLHGMAFEYLYRQGILPSVTGTGPGTGTGSTTCAAVPGTSIIYLSGNYGGLPVSNPNEPNRSFFSLSANQPVATSVRRQRSDNDPRLSADIIQNGNMPVYDVCLSECPGSFEIPPGNEGNPSNCKLTGVSTPSVTLTWATRDARSNECRVRADKPLYVNTRLVNCPDGNCGLSVGQG